MGPIGLESIKNQLVFYPVDTKCSIQLIFWLKHVSPIELLVWMSRTLTPPSEFKLYHV